MVKVELVHFNDVYHVAPSKEEPVGGAARFVTKLNEIRSKSELDEEPLALFSGDAFNPSLESTITRGSHMPEILNQFKIAAACLGNHDFDFGMPQLEKLIGQTDFYWLLSNVVDDVHDSRELAFKDHIIIEHFGLRIGFIGLVEKEWIQTIPSFPPELMYHDFVGVGQRLGGLLKDPKGPYKVDLVIALTHMRVPNDIALARTCKAEIDLVLGGHDHFYYVSKDIDIVGDTWSREKNLDDVGFDPEAIPDRMVNGLEDHQRSVRVVKSGTDFREFSFIKLDVEEDSGRKYIKEMSVERIVIDSSIEPDKKTEQLVEEAEKRVSAKTNTAIGYTTVPLDGRSMSVRTEETNLGNLTADLMMMHYRNINAEIGFCVGGTIRNDSVIEPGEITFGDILTAFPFLDPVVVIRVTGQQLWDALENSVSEYPKQEGRFPQLAGIRLEWDPNAPPGSRVRSVHKVVNNSFGVSLIGTKSNRPRSLVLPRMVDHNEKYNPANMVPIDLEREYVVATRAYLLGGYDGYSAFKVPKNKIIIDEEMGVPISNLYRKFFLGLKYINAFREYQAKHIRSEARINRLVASAARHWRGIAMQFKKHNHPMDGRECECDTDSADGRVFLNTDIEKRASYHISRDGITDAFIDSSRGHPYCIEPEEREDSLIDSVYSLDSDMTWVKRWASISPVVEGRIVRVED